MTDPVTEPMLKEKRAEVSVAIHDAAPAAKARTDADRNRTDKAAIRPGEGTGDLFSEAEIDALECVVEDGRIVGMSVYGALRSLLVRLRPEWEGEDQEPERTHGVRHTQSECTEQAEGSVPPSRTENKPVAWALICGDCLDSTFTDRDEAVEWACGIIPPPQIVPLYRQPQPTLTDAEREAIEDGARCCEYMAGYKPMESRADLAASAETLRGLLERMQ